MNAFRIGGIFSLWMATAAFADELCTVEGGKVEGRFEVRDGMVFRYLQPVAVASWRDVETLRLRDGLDAPEAWLHEIQLRDGSRLHARSVQLEAGELRFTHRLLGEVKLHVSHLERIRFPAGREIDASSPAGPAGVLLRSGEFVALECEAIDGRSARFFHPLVGRFDWELAWIREVRLHLPGEPPEISFPGAMVRLRGGEVLCAELRALGETAALLPAWSTPIDLPRDEVVELRALGGRLIYASDALIQPTQLRGANARSRRNQGLQSPLARIGSIAFEKNLACAAGTTLEREVPEAALWFRTEVGVEAATRSTLQFRIYRDRIGPSYLIFESPALAPDDAPFHSGNLSVSGARRLLLVVEPVPGEDPDPAASGVFGHPCWILAP